MKLLKLTSHHSKLLGIEYTRTSKELHIMPSISHMIALPDIFAKMRFLPSKASTKHKLIDLENLSNCKPLLQCT